jgi:hypothetical protein
MMQVQASYGTTPFTWASETSAQSYPGCHKQNNCHCSQVGGVLTEARLDCAFPQLTCYGKETPEVVHEPICNGTLKLNRENVLKAGKGNLKNVKLQHSTGDV